MLVQLLVYLLQQELLTICFQIAYEGNARYGYIAVSFIHFTHFSRAPIFHHGRLIGHKDGTVVDNYFRTKIRHFFFFYEIIRKHAFIKENSCRNAFRA